MATNRNIPVDFVRSTKRKIDVHIENLHDLQYEYAHNFKIHSYPSGGAIKTEALLTTSITMAILLIIVGAVMLSLNG